MMRAPGLPAPPSTRLEGVIRLPYPQDAHGAVTRQFQASLMIADAIGRAGTTASNRKCTAPLESPQMFVTQPSGGVNTPGQMATGAPKVNARRAVSQTRGQSAGIV